MHLLNKPAQLPVEVNSHSQTFKSNRDREKLMHLREVCSHLCQFLGKNLLLEAQPQLLLAWDLIKWVEARPKAAKVINTRKCSIGAHLD
jgi:hypothetical protein